MTKSEFGVKLLCKAGSTMLRRTLRHASKAGIVAALVPLGMIGLPGQAQAQPQQRSYVAGTATEQVSGRYLYEFTVYNTSTPGDDDDDDGYGYGGGFLIVDWELPLIVPSGQTWSDVVDTIHSPTTYPSGPAPTFVGEAHTWYYEVINPEDGEVYETNNPDFDSTYSEYWGTDSGPYGEYGWTWTKEDDPFWQENNDVYGAHPDRWLTPTHLIHWYTPDVPEESPLAPIAPEEWLGGFSFMSDISGGNAPYMASWEFEPSTIGDPPSPQGGGPLPGIPGPTVVPLPAAFPVAFIVMTGMAGVGYLRRRAVR